MRRPHLYKQLRQALVQYPVVAKICGAICIVLGIIAMIAPIIPGIWLVVIGLELMGVHFLFIDRLLKPKSEYKAGPVQVWHALSLPEVARRLKTTLDKGLSAIEAKKRLELYGPNQLLAADRPSIARLLLNQGKNTFTLILLCAILVSLALGQVYEAVAIGVIVCFAVVLGFIQEWRAEQAFEALQELVAPLSNVLRDGLEQVVPAASLVIGDIILLATGDRVPADVRLLSASALHIDESVLTGESVAVEKNLEQRIHESATIGDRLNMVFAGTLVTYGRGRAIVVTTNMQTEFGKITNLLQKVKREHTPLQKDLERIGRSLTLAVAILVSILGALSMLRGQSFFEALVYAVALAVAVVPEALPAVVTIALAIGVQRMARRHALIRYLPAAETLGCTTYICSDKTGTLTKDEMTIRRICLADGTELRVSGSGYDPTGEFQEGDRAFFPSRNLVQLLQAAALSSDAQLAETNGVWGLKGDPTEAAFVVAAAKAGLQKELLDEQFPRVAEIPFSSEAKRMTTLHETPEGTVAYVKGAAEIILESCDRLQTDFGVEPLNDARRDTLLHSIHSYAQDALRVIGVASVPAADLTQVDHSLIFLGFVGMIDPPRPEAKAAIQKCREAGIKLMMITGDHADTASAVARELGLLLPGGRVVTGFDLASLTQNQLERTIESISVCARVSPEHKLRVVQALQTRGHVVAMTGDGINDAPALKRADIGIAMGITGTNVTKEVAAMILADDNFASIVAAVEEGRIIFVNIKKFLVYLLSSNLGEIGLIAATSLLGLPLPLTALQLLYINLASDGLPALALAVDPDDGDVMRQPPRRLKQGLFNRPLLVLMLAGGAWVMLAHVSLYTWLLQTDLSTKTITSMVFASLVLMQLTNTYCLRSQRHSLLHTPLRNRWLNRAVIWEIACLMLVLYLPFFQTALQTTGLSAHNWIVVILTATSTIPVTEMAKRIAGRLE